MKTKSSRLSNDLISLPHTDVREVTELVQVAARYAGPCYTVVLLIGAVKVASGWANHSWDLGVYPKPSKHFLSNETSWKDEGGSQPLDPQSWDRSVSLLATIPFLSTSVLSLLKKGMGWLLQFGVGRDPLLYTLLLVETNLAVCRSFLSRNRDYFNNLILEDQGQYHFLLRQASRRPFSRLVLLPGVWPSALQKGEKKQVERKRGTVNSFLENQTDLEFHIKWLFCQDIGLTLDTVIDREDVCGLRASSVVNQELELYVSVQSTEHLLESMAFGVRYCLFAKYLVIVAQGLLKIGR